jgi:hypothetical protein
LIWRSPYRGLTFITHQHWQLSPEQNDPGEHWEQVAVCAVTVPEVPAGQLQFKKLDEPWGEMDVPGHALDTTPFGQ